MQITGVSHFQLQPPSSLSEAKAGQSRKTLPDGVTSLLVKTCTVPPRGTSWILGYLAVPGSTVRNLGAGNSPGGTVCMSHRRVAALWHSIIQSHADLQVDAYRQRLGEGNSEIKPHSPRYGSNSFTALLGLGIVKG